MFHFSNKTGTATAKWLHFSCMLLISFLLILHLLPGRALAADAGYTMTPDSATLEVGGQLTLQVLQDGVPVSNATFASSNPKVASVSDTGLVTGVSAGSATIVGTVNGTMVESLISVVKKTSQSTSRYNVLVLDTSGSMKGQPLVKEKAAAKRFCKRVLKADGSNQIAILALYKKDVKVVSNFSSSYKKLSKVINQQKAGASTNLNSALSKAEALLDQAPNGDQTMKNIILCSDGLGKNGETQELGHYTIADGEKYYRHANKTYDTDVAIKEKNIFVYALGFFQNATGDKLIFGKKHMKDLASEDKYFEVENPSDFDEIFTVIADDISDQTPSYKIYTVEDLKSVQLDLAGDYTLMSSIDLSGEACWTPLGNDETPFTGTFDGNDYTISNMTIETQDGNQGLFGVTKGAKIKKLTVSGQVTTTGTYAAGIVGHAKDGTLINRCLNLANVNGNEQAAGVVGRVSNSTVVNCQNEGTITSNGRGCGGITADLYPSGTILNCNNLGNIEGNSYLTGGISGGSTSGTIRFCNNYGNVSASSQSGAIAGDNSSYSGERAYAFFRQTEDVNKDYKIIGDGCRTYQNAADEFEPVEYEGKTYTKITDLLNAVVFDENREQPVAFVSWGYRGELPVLEL